MEISNNYSRMSQPHFNGYPSRNTRNLLMTAAESKLRSITEKANEIGERVDIGLLEAVMTEMKTIYKGIEVYMKKHHPNTILNMTTRKIEGSDEIVTDVKFINSCCNGSVLAALITKDTPFSLTNLDGFRELLSVLSKDLPPQAINNEFLTRLINGLKEQAAKSPYRRKLLSQMQDVDSFSRSIGETRGTIEKLDPEITEIIRQKRLEKQELARKEQELARKRKNAEENNNVLNHYLRNVESLINIKKI